MAMLLALPMFSYAAGNCRPIEHALGTSCVPAHPVRIAVLDTGELDIAIALGITPIAATSAYQINALPDYLPAITDEVISLGMIQEPDLELLLKLQPDLIISSKLRHGRIYDQLSGIAPTVFSESIGASWIDNLRLFADALNRSAKADIWIEKFEQQCRTVQEKYNKLGKPPLSVVRSLQTHIRLYLPDSFIGSILQHCGLQRPISQQGKGFAVRLRSPSKITQLEAPLILLSEYSPSQGSLIQDWQKSPFWRLLKGKTYPVNDSYWMLGIGPIAAQKVLNDLQSILDNYAAN
ncbi:ABC transporter substrate-binding protein [Aliamphritea ceti]|uniref:ABC transporter substrate-binding protein n=1 Tax=Aliamphritea ceti TaxID=1524258 RepID=UPI0021C4A9A5|nr:iron-siderophore ABC transporter substrate-binding protein [Aliamphritea ceti]